MDSFRKELRKKGIIFSLRYFGIDDLATSWEVKSIIDNADLFTELSLKHRLINITTLDDFYTYLFFQKLIRMRIIIPQLSQEGHKALINRLSNNAEQAVCEIQTGDVIKYINTNIQNIFNCKDSQYDIRFATMDIIAQYCTGISEDTYEYLCKQFGYLMIDRFEQFEKIFEKYPGLFDCIYTPDYLENPLSLRLEKSLDIWQHILRKKQSNLKTLVEGYIEVLANNIRKICAEATKDNIMQVDKTTREFHSFLQRIKSTKENEFNVLVKNTSKLLSVSIEEQGQSFQYEIPVEEIMRRWKGTDNWEVRLLLITHEVKNNDDGFVLVSRLSKEPESLHPILDSIWTNIVTDEYFSFSHQQMLSILISIGTSTMMGIMRNKDTLIDYLNLVASAIVLINDNLNIKDDQLQQDMEIFSSMVQLVSNNLHNKNGTIDGIIYGTTMYICAFLEKLLRIIYLDLMKDEKYLSTNKITLGELLNVNNLSIRMIFGEYHIRNLAYFLLKDVQSNVGLNIRNGLQGFLRQKVIVV